MNSDAAQGAATFQEKCNALQEFVMEHMRDSHTLVLPYFHVSLPSFITVHGLMLVISMVLLALVFGVAGRRRGEVPTRLAGVLEAFVVFIRDEISVRFLGEEDGRRMTPIFCSFFFFILTLNLVGLVPSLSAATANLSVTGALAAVSFGFMVVGALVAKGPVSLMKSFAPPGVPWLILPMLVPIEMIGVATKAAALMIRLFANMLAGHMVIFFILGMVFVIGAWALPLIVLGVMMYMLELGIAFLQAYIFTLLSAGVIGQRYHPEH
jgi:F-type H+-transporting ATPase subunit a